MPKNKIGGNKHKKGKKHVLIGKMFGYTCPTDLNQIFVIMDKGKPYYDIKTSHSHFTIQKLFLFDKK